MDSRGSLVDTNLKIYPSEKLLKYIKTITVDDNVPINILKLVKGINYEAKHIKNKEDSKPFLVQFTDKDIENLNKITDIVNKIENIDDISDVTSNKEDNKSLSKETGEVDPIYKTNNLEVCEETSKKASEVSSKENIKKDDPKNALNDDQDEDKDSVLYLTTTDIDWLYVHLQNKKIKGAADVPYLHTLLEGASIEMPDNIVIKRNPVLEARCVKLRAQQEAREYRKMTKTVDNVRMRYPEDSISYQLKQLNRHLIAIGQFIISIFAGFLFGFKGIEWMIGHLDFGFRLLLGVMCALIISLAEIYFLAKHLNEELNIPETVQLGGPPKFANPPKLYDYIPKEPSKDLPTQSIDKEHQD